MFLNLIRWNDKRHNAECEYQSIFHLAVKFKKPERAPNETVSAPLINSHLYEFDSNIENWKKMFMQIFITNIYMICKPRCKQKCV